MERYIDLIHDHPQIEQDVPQKEIAEYLRIKPYSLSRIKKEDLRKKQVIFSKTYTQVYIRLLERYPNLFSHLHYILKGIIWM